MATYSREDFEEIASAIDKDIADVCQQEKHFEAAAMWYRLDRKAPKRQTKISPERALSIMSSVTRFSMMHRFEITSSRLHNG